MSEGLELYARQKQETREIVNRIQAKHYSDITRQRAEGLQIADDFRFELKRTLRKSQTHKLTLQRNRTLRQRLLSQQIQPKSRSLQTEDKKSLENPILDEVSLVPLQQDEVQIEKGNRKAFLPMLQLWIKEQQSLRCMDGQQKKIRNIVTQMMVLALARRHHGKLMEALDILLQTEAYLPASTPEMRHLKAVWLQLIAKIHLQMKQVVKKQTGRSRWKEPTRKLSLKQAKRQSTIVIRSLASRRVFLNRFSNSMRKMKLLLQTTHTREANNPDNAVDQTATGRNIVARLGGLYAISYPPPELLFPNHQNYGLVVVRRDSQNRLFPFIYPQSLEGRVEKKNYKQQICKLNSVLVPNTRCCNLNSALRTHFQSILLIFLTLLVAVAACFAGPPQLHWLALAIPLLIVTLSGWYIQKGGRSSDGTISQAMMRMMLQWQEQYNPEHLRIIISEDAEVLVISFPLLEEESEVSSQPSQEDSLRNKQTSMLFFNPMQSDAVQQQSDSSEDTDQAEMELDCQLLGEHQDESAVASSMDQVIGDHYSEIQPQPIINPTLFIVDDL